MDKLVTIAENQIERLTEIQNQIGITKEEQINISIEIRKWSEFIHNNL